MGLSGSSGPNQSAPVPRAMPVLAMLGLAPYETWIWYGDGGKVGWPAPDVCSLIRVLLCLIESRCAAPRKRWVGVPEA